MTEAVEEKSASRVRGRPFAKGQSGNPGGRRLGSRNKATLAAQMLLADEAEALTRKAVELAPDGDPTALRLCIERALPRDRAVRFTMPRIASAADVAGAMGAVAAALAQGIITPCEASQIAQVIVTFVRTIETSDFDRRLQIIETSQAAQRSFPPGLERASHHSTVW
jgi:Family of unknown function (DUF5681)